MCQNYLTNNLILTNNKLQIIILIIRQNIERMQGTKSEINGAEYRIWVSTFLIVKLDRHLSATKLNNFFLINNFQIIFHDLSIKIVQKLVLTMLRYQGQMGFILSPARACQIELLKDFSRKRRVNWMQIVYTSLRASVESYLIDKDRFYRFYHSQCNRWPIRFFDSRCKGVVKLKLRAHACATMFSKA